MSENLLISVVIPIYNIQDYITKCVETVLIPGYEDKIEVLLVNDGSKDNSKEVCETIIQDHASFRIKLLNKENGGLSDARNYGIQNSTGKYVFFLDGDDFLDSDEFLSFLIRLEETNADVILNNYKEYDENSKKLYQVNDELGKVDLNKFSKNEFICYIMNDVANSMWSAWKYVVKREILFEENLMFGVSLLCEDIDWTVRLLAQVKNIEYSGLAFYCYRTNREGSIINTVNIKKEIDIINISTNRINYVQNSQLSSDAKSAIIDRLLIEIFVLCLIHVQMHNTEDGKHLLNVITENRKLLELAESKKMKKIRLMIFVLGLERTSKLLYRRNRNQNINTSS